MWTTLSKVPLHFLGQDDQNDVQHDFFGHATPLGISPGIVSMASLHFLGQDNQNEVQHDFLVT